MNTVRWVEHTPTDDSRPLAECVITNCGELKPGEDDGIVTVQDGDAFPDFPEDSEAKTIAEKLKAAEAIKAVGNDYFKKQKFGEAANKYEKCLRYLEEKYPSPEEKHQLEQAKLPCHSNLAACYLKVGDYFKAVEQCDIVLKADPKNLKVLFRRGQAHTYKNDFERAKVDFSEALKLDPNSAEVKNAVIFMNQRKAELEKKEAAVFSKMFK